MKNSFVMYTDWKLMIETLSNESRGELLLAIMQYQAGEEVDIDDPFALIAFASMRPQFDRDNEKYEESRQKRSEAGKIAAEARKSKSNRNDSLPIATNEVQSLHVDVDVDDIKESTLKGTKEKRFAPPTVEQVKEYCAERGYAVDAERFVDFYASKNWMVGKNKMKDWKAALRNWARSEKAERQEKAAKPDKFNNFENGSFGDIGELERKLLTAREG